MTGLYGLAGQVVGSGPTATVYLYATSYTIADPDKTYLYGITDTLGTTTNPGTSFTVLDTAPADSNFKGVSFAPTIPAGSVEINTSPSGLMFTTTGIGCAPGTYTAPQTLAWTSGNYCTLSVVSPQSNSTSTESFVQWEDGSTTLTHTVTAPVSTAVYTATFAPQPPSYIYALDTYNNRVEVFDTSLNYLSQFGSGGNGNGQFSGPTGIATDASGNVWVADLRNNRIEEFSSSGVYLAQFGSAGSGNGKFSNPTSVGIDSNGNIFVLDGYNARVQKFTSTGTFIMQFGSYGSGNGQFGINPSNGANSIPQALAIDGNNNVWVTDTYNNRVEEFSNSGTFIMQFGYYGSDNGQFNAPKGIAIDSSGNIWVTDVGNNRVQEFNFVTGAFVSQFGTAGGGNGQFSGPTSPVVDSNGNIYVVDGENARVQKFNSGETFVTKVGNGWPGGSGNGQFGINPSGGQTGVAQGLAISTAAK